MHLGTQGCLALWSSRSGLDQTSGGVDFSFLGHHSIYSKPWQWYMTQAVCKPYDLKMIFFNLNH